MSNLARTIKKLEQEIIADKNAMQLHFSSLKTNLNSKLSSPAVLVLTLIGGGLIVKKFKRRLKIGAAAQGKAVRIKTSLLQRIMGLSSELSIAFNVFKRLKNMAGPLIEKAKTI